MKYRTLTFCSLNRDTGDNETPTFILNPPIEKLSKIKVLECHIPNSFYNFDKEKIGIREENPTPDGHKNFDIEITGNFTATELCSYLSAALTAKSATDGYGFTYTVTYGYDGRFTFTAVGGDFHLRNDTSCGIQLGFHNFPQSSGPSETGDSVAQLQKIAILVKSKELSYLSSVESRGYYNQVSNNDVLAVVPITNNYYEISNYHNDTMELIDADERVFLKYISFELTDIYNNPIRLNSVPWIIKIGFLE